MRARDNPLATDRLESLSYRFLESSWPEFLSRLQAYKNRGAIVGSEGSGKTTLLEELEARLKENGFNVVVYGLKKDRRRVPLTFWWKKLDKQNFVFLDGAEQLNTIEWWMFKLKTLNAGGLVVTSHEPGLLPTVIACDTNMELFKNLLGELLDEDVPEELIQETYEKAAGNIRLAFLFLYDYFASYQPGMMVSHKMLSSKGHIR